MNEKAVRMETQSRASDPAVRLVIADVDGTLVTQEKVLTARAIEAASRLHEAGVLFAITTGRPPKGAKMVIDALNLSQPTAAFNGGVVVNADLSIADSHLLGSDVTPDIIRLIGEHGLD